MREQTQLKIEYKDFRRIQPTQLDNEQRTLVRQLSQDIPTPRNAPTTPPQDRQQIVQMLIDRIVYIEGKSERTEITLTWAGGFTSRHQHNRTVIRYSQLSNLNELLAHIVELKETCTTLGDVADQINKEGYCSLRRRTFTSAMISRLLVKVIISAANEAETARVLSEIQQSGECWCGPSVWKGTYVICISVCSWRTTENNIQRTSNAFEAVLCQAR